jgi:Coenzyme PQQ synthesis protein D (PqqD)
MQGVKVAAMLKFLASRLWGKTPDHLKSGHLGFRIAPDVKASPHAEGIVLINLSRGTIFSANSVGAMIWNAAAERWSLDRVAASISTQFHIPPQTAQQDAAEFLAQLAAEGLLVTDAS